MIEVMFPSIRWNDEDWCIKELKSIKDGVDVLRACDGGVSNVILDCKSINNVEKNIKVLFQEIDWIDKILVKHNNELVGIYQNKN